MLKSSRKEISSFQKLIIDFYRQHGRMDLPWRKKSRTPYQIVVSEIMLQQTQVERVIHFYTTWMRVFPNFKTLASAPQSTVLRYWKGLGYNSRALRLHKLAKIVVQKYRGQLPKTRHELEALPGIGPYTAGAILVFAYHQPNEIFIETNIRRAFIHHFFQDKKNIHDNEIIPLIKESLPDSRDISHFDWYSALMDYGATLPKIINHNPNTKSKHYVKQSKFNGSDRQIRGAILDILLHTDQTAKKLVQQLNLIIGYSPNEQKVNDILNDLLTEGFIQRAKGKRAYRLKN